MVSNPPYWSLFVEIIERRLRTDRSNPPLKSQLGLVSKYESQIQDAERKVRVLDQAFKESKEASDKIILSLQLKLADSKVNEEYLLEDLMQKDSTIRSLNRQILAIQKPQRFQRQVRESYEHQDGEDDPRNQYRYSDLAFHRE
jgi:hypothetical protein